MGNASEKNQANLRGLDLDKVVFGIPELVVNVLLLAIRPEPVPTLH